MDDRQDGAEWQSVHILVAAQRQADQVVEDARVMAAQVAGDAEVLGEKIIAEALATASRYRIQAEQDADRLLVEARAKAPLEAQARYTYYRAMGDALSAQLSATLAGLSQAISAYEKQSAEPEPMDFPGLNAGGDS